MRVQLHLGGPAPEHQPYAGRLRLGHEQLVVGALRPGPRGQPVRQQPVLGPLQLDRAPDQLGGDRRGDPLLVGHGHQPVAGVSAQLWGPAPLAFRANTCSDRLRRRRPPHARARHRPRVDPVRRRRGRGRGRAAVAAGRRGRRTHLGRPAGRAAAGEHRAGAGRLDRGAPARRRRRGAGVRAVRHQHRDGHRAGQRHRAGVCGPARADRRDAHPERGQGRRVRQRPRRQGPGRGDGGPDPAARRHPEARRRRRRAGAGHHPDLARRRPGPDRRGARRRRTDQPR